MTFHLYPRVNHAPLINPPGGDVHITTHASDWLWAVFAVMLISWLIALPWAYSNTRRFNRIVHFIPTIVLAVSSVAYFAMASDLGWTLVRSEFHSHLLRQIWYVRYIQWFINAPLILLELLSFTKMASPEILVPLFFSWYLVVNGLVGALVPTSYKWGFFVFGLFGLFFIWSHLFAHVNSIIHPEFREGYITGAVYISFIWMLYPVCWGLSEGSSTISPTSEMVFYGILDIMSGPVFLLIFFGLVSGAGSERLEATGLGNANRGSYEHARPAKAEGAPQVPPATLAARETE